MSVVAHRATDGETSPPEPRGWVRREIGWLAPSLVAVANAVAFAIIAPNVNDIFAAIARESAVLHGVGPKYWFSWFGGGSTPGNYSVLTPYLSALVGAVTLAAIATAACTPLAWFALRDTSRPVLGMWLVTLTAGLNLWSGRVPFALGCLMTIALVVMLRQGRQWLAALFGMLAVASSPVSGAFLLLALSGLFLTAPQWRRRCLLVAAPIMVALLVVAVAFGQPGPETFSFVQLLQLTAALGVFLVARPPSWLRASIWVALLAGPVVFLVPNGLGDNILRFAAYCLPAVVIATSRARTAWALAGISVALSLSIKTSVRDVVEGAGETASPDYYTTLVAELTKIEGQLRNCRLEVVEDGTHTASYALLDHAMLARGYEYQEDNALNGVLSKPDLGPTAYKIWLQDNAVCYVAISSTQRKPSPEYALVSKNRPDYLAEVWQDDKWALYKVAHPNPIVAPPVSVTSFSQSALVLHVPCACTFQVRVRKPGNLRAQTSPPANTDRSPVRATLAPDGFGWTTMTTTQPGDYTLTGSI